MQNMIDFVAGEVRANFGAMKTGKKHGDEWYIEVKKDGEHHFEVIVRGFSVKMVLACHDVYRVSASVWKRTGNGGFSKRCDDTLYHRDNTEQVRTFIRRASDVAKQLTQSSDGLCPMIDFNWAYTKTNGRVDSHHDLSGAKVLGPVGIGADGRILGAYRGKQNGHFGVWCSALPPDCDAFWLVSCTRSSNRTVLIITDGEKYRYLIVGDEITVKPVSYDVEGKPTGSLTLIDQKLIEVAIKVHLGVA